MGKHRILAGLVTAALLAAGIYVIAPAASATTARTLRLFEHDTQQTMLDLGDKGSSPGDQFIFSGDLFDHEGGTKLGRFGGYCTTIGGVATKEGDVLCSASFMLARGQIMTQGLFDAAAFFGGQTLTFPIVGGTGLYRNARGEGSIQLPSQTDANFVLHLD